MKGHALAGQQRTVLTEPVNSLNRPMNDKIHRREQHVKFVWQSTLN